MGKNIAWIGGLIILQSYRINLHLISGLLLIMLIKNLQDCLNEKLKENHLKDFEYIIVTGAGKFVPPDGMDWRDEQVCIGKHRSTGASFTMGFKVCTSKHAYTIDDDVVPPDMGFSKLYQTIKNKTEIGAIAGLYFTHEGWETGNPWRTPSQLQRTVVASIEQSHWFLQ